MTTRALPKELVELARALKEASAKEPSAAKASAIERRMESLIRQLRRAQKGATQKARTERENEEIRAQAKSWAEKGPSGDPGRRHSRHKKSGYNRFVAAFAKKNKGGKNLLKRAAARWRGLSAAAKAKYSHAKRRAKSRSKGKRRASHRDPGWHARSSRTRHTRARRHRAKRHQARRRHGRRDPS